MVPSLKSFGGYLALHMYKVKQINLHPCALKRTWDNTALMRFDVVHSDDTRRRPAHLLALLRLVRAERAALGRRWGSLAMHKLKLKEWDVRNSR